MGTHELFSSKGLTGRSGLFSSKIMAILSALLSFSLGCSQSSFESGSSKGISSQDRKQSLNPNSPSSSGDQKVENVVDSSTENKSISGNVTDSGTLSTGDDTNKVGNVNDGNNGNNGNNTNNVTDSAVASDMINNVLETADAKLKQENLLEGVKAMSKSFDIVKKRENFWTVTTGGLVTYFAMEDEKIVQKKQWTVWNSPSTTGARTLVIDSGLVFGRNGGYIWYINPDTTPQGNLEFKPSGANHSFKLNGPAETERVCIVTYKRDGRNYLGLGYGMGKFAEMSLSDKAPYGPTWQITRTVDLKHPFYWGYSCYVDKSKLIYYSQWISGEVGALSLADLKSVVPKTKANNGAFISTTFPALTIGASNSAANSYSIFGDRDGNVYNGTGYYTYAHDHVNGFIWASHTSGDVRILSKDCLTSLAVCPKEKANVTFSLGALGIAIGPMSSTSGGSIIGLTRGTGNIYLLKLADQLTKDLSKGIKATLLDNAGGDPYMYVDFTGSTLYTPDTKMLVKLVDDKSYAPDQITKYILFSWASKLGKGQLWTGMTLQMRCFKDGEAKGDFQKIEPIKNSGDYTKINLSTCNNAIYDTVEFGISSTDGNKAVQNVSELTISYKQ